MQQYDEKAGKCDDIVHIFVGMPVLGCIASLIAMKFYLLDKEKMVEVQAKIAAMTVKHFPGKGARENGFDPHWTLD